MGARSRTGKSSKGAANAGIEPALKKEAKSKDVPTALWRKVVDKEVELTPEEVLKAAHWIRQGLAIVVGSIFGIIPFTGAPAILTYLVFSTFGPPAILKLFNEIDVEEVSKISSIQFEGVMPSFALFMLTWIVSYTVFLPPRS